MANSPSAGLSILAKEQTSLEILKQYAGFIISNKVYKSKTECESHVKKVISALMDKGECTFSTYDKVVAFMKQYNPSSQKDIADKEYTQAVEQIMLNVVVDSAAIIASGVQVNLAVSEKAIIDEFINSKATYEAAKLKVCELLKQPTTNVAARLISGHESLLNVLFIDQLKDNVKTTLTI